MAEKTLAKPSFRSLRLKAIAAAVKRGDGNYNIWSAYSTKTRKDCILIGDAEYLNFHWMEGDPGIATFTVDSDLYLADQDESNGATYPDAVTTLRDGRIEWREVKAVEPEAGTERDIRQESIQRRITEDLGYKYVRVTPALLKKNWQFICNWRRATAFCSAVRYLSVQRFEAELAAFVDARKAIVLNDFTRLYSITEEPLAIAAFFKCAQDGRILTDLHKASFGPRTKAEAPCDRLA